MRDRRLLPLLHRLVLDHVALTGIRLLIVAILLSRGASLIRGLSFASTAVLLLSSSSLFSLASRLFLLLSSLLFLLLASLLLDPPLDVLDVRRRQDAGREESFKKRPTAAAVFRSKGCARGRGRGREECSVSRVHVACIACAHETPGDSPAGKLSPPLPPCRFCSCFRSGSSCGFACSSPPLPPDSSPPPPPPPPPDSSSPPPPPLLPSSPADGDEEGLCPLFDP